MARSYRLPALSRALLAARAFFARVREVGAGPGLALCLALFTPACANFRRERGVSFASDPPGARVILDGEDSGFVTPCLLYLPTDDNKFLLELVRPGYEPARRILLENTSRHVLLWSDMEVYYNTWRFPLFLNFEDFFIPVTIDDEAHPARIFVRLKRSADP